MGTKQELELGNIPTKVGENYLEIISIKDAIGDEIKNLKYKFVVKESEENSKEGKTEHRFDIDDKNTIVYTDNGEAASPIR